MIRRPPRSTHCISSAASDVYKRQGSDTLKFIAALEPRRIHYASCHPPTLARDLGLLIARGYELKSIEMLDFFPQTFHIESMAKLVPKHP